MLETPFCPPGLLAHSAVSAARVATIKCVDHDGEIGPTTTARLLGSGDLTLAARIDRRSAVAIRVVTAPEVIVDVAAPTPFGIVRFNGYARRATAADGGEVLRVAPTHITLVGDLAEIDVPLTDYTAAAQHPIATEAPRALAHLAEAHSDQLLACVRAHIDQAIECVVPRALDSYGLSLTVLTPDGVADVVLGFPDAPVATLKQAAAHIGAVLTCPCHSRRS